MSNREIVCNYHQNLARKRKNQDTLVTNKTFKEIKDYKQFLTLQMPEEKELNWGTEAEINEK